MGGNVMVLSGVACVSLHLALGLAVLAAPTKQDIVIFRDPAKYSAFPSLYYDGGDRLWVAFGWNTTRSHYGSHAGGESGHYQFLSPDLGEHWIREDEEGFVGAPADLTALKLSDGTVVRAGARGWEALEPDRAEEFRARGLTVRELKPSGKLVACYRAAVRVSKDGGETWDAKYLEFPDVALLHGGPAEAIALPDDTILAPVYGRRIGDKTGGRCWCLRSTDRGQTWELITAAYDGRHPFAEWAVVHAGGGRVVGLIRGEGGSTATCPMHEIGYLYQVNSEDGGKTWDDPARAPMWGYPPTLIRLKDGALLASYGYRRPPYGVRACFSYDDGRTWDWKKEVILRTDGLPDGPGKGASIGDLGYPRSVELRDGTIFTAYYITLGDTVTHIAASRWTRDYLGPLDIPRGQDAVPEPDPSLPPCHLVGETGAVDLVYGVQQMFVPVEPKVAAAAVRVAAESGKYPHTYGLFCVLRQPNEEGNWWGKWIAQSETLAPDAVKTGGWNLFRFDPAVEVTPGEEYVLTVYNADYDPTPVRLKEGLEGDHRWILNAGPPEYPNGGTDARNPLDIGFCVYGETPKEPPRDPE